MMSLPAANLYFASPHPWSSAIRSFAELSFLALVVQIEDAEHAFAQLRYANHKGMDESEHMAVAQRLKSVFSRCVVIDATPTFLQSIDRKTLHAATIHIRKQFMDLSVPKGVDLLRGLITGTPMPNCILPNTVRSPKMRLTIHARDGQSGHLQILLTSSLDVDTNPPLIGSNLLLSLLDSSAPLLVCIGLDGQISYLNHGMAEITGAQIFGRKTQISDILTHESAVRFTQVSTMISMSGRPWHGFLEVMRPDTGATTFVQCRVDLVRDHAEQRTLGYVISGQKAPHTGRSSIMESQNADAISQSARFEIVGKIAADMIYDATGSLGVIQNASEELKLLAQQNKTQDLSFIKDPVRHQAQRISMMSHRVQSIVDVIDGLARDGAQEKNDHVSLNDLLAEVSDIVQHFAKNIGVSVDVERPQQVLTVPVQRLRIGQVLTNLLINACEAVKGSPDGLVKLAIICDEEWIYIAVTNAGRPIPAETRMRLFEPDFSTKKGGLRTGVGLFASRQIAREHGGDLYFDDTSELTRFVLELPLLKPTTANQDDDSWEEI